MSCAGCLPNEKEQQAAIDRVTKEAKQYAIDKRQMVMVYKTDEGEIAYISLEQGYALGIRPIKRLSFLQ